MNKLDADNSKKFKAVLFKSEERVQAFEEQLNEKKIDYTLLDFESHEWLDFDYSDIDFITYYSNFKYSSNRPHALHDVYDNLMFLHSEYPEILIYPDPNIIKFYNDKYKQFLFLKNHNYPIPETIPLLSPDSLDIADKALGYPMIVKNRYGAGGGSVFRVFNKRELTQLFNISTLNLFNIDSIKYFFKLIKDREFYWHLIKNKRAIYPFLSPPLLAQKYVKIDRDLKTVVGNYRIVEGHWRLQANEDMWKVNIDDGGIGVWSEIPPEPIDISVRLAKELKASWLNLDMIISNGKYLITEFSPVWHHYAYKEKPTFIYQDDYNIDIPLETSLNLEKIIVESLIDRLKAV